MTASDWRNVSTYVQHHNEIISVDLGTAGTDYSDRWVRGGENEGVEHTEGELHDEEVGRAWEIDHDHQLDQYEEGQLDLGEEEYEDYEDD